MAVGDLTHQPAYQDRVTLFPSHAEVVTPSDAEDFESPVGVMAGGAGDVTAVPALPPGSDAITVTLEAGQFVPFLCRRVNATGTTATNIVAVW